MDEYKAREIKFKEIYETEGWSIKIYTISQDGDFDHPKFYENVKMQLPEWLSMQNSFVSSKDKFGFLILHVATEGIFSLINWWVGKNMVNTHVFLTNPNEPNDFLKISGDGLFACVWELEVIHHESTSWLRHVLKQGSNPNYPAYLNDVYNGIL